MCMPFPLFQIHDPNIFRSITELLSIWIIYLTNYVPYYLDMFLFFLRLWKPWVNAFTLVGLSWILNFTWRLGREGAISRCRGGREMKFDDGRRLAYHSFRFPAVNGCGRCVRLIGMECSRCVFIILWWSWGFFFSPVFSVTMLFSLFFLISSWLMIDWNGVSQRTFIRPTIEETNWLGEREHFVSRWEMILS